MSERLAAMDDFIASVGWGDAVRAPIQGDASTRSYTRLEMGGHRAVLMNAPRGDEAPGEPEGASVEDRVALGYNAVARLAGPNMEAFLCLATELTKRGFSAPEILAADAAQGFALIEDLGGDDYDVVLRRDLTREPALYTAAIDTLAALHRSSFSKIATQGDHIWPIRDYDQTALLAETALLLDWYAPDTGVLIPQAARAEHDALWCRAFKMLDSHAPGLALRDFHAQNLFWLPDREGQAQVGLIDFQDALFAHPAYDLASLLEDARRDVDPALFAPMIARFIDKAGLRDADAFGAAYAVTAAQRNAKILGIFVRLAVRDGKPAYRTLIPRVATHFRRDLTHSACADLRGWYHTHIPELFS